MEDEKILISRDAMNKLKTGLGVIKVNTREKDIRKEAERLLKIVEEEFSADFDTLEQNILEKMRETKRSDPELNANLYILHRKLVNGQISEREALALFQVYLKLEPYDKMF